MGGKKKRERKVMATADATGSRGSAAQQGNEAAHELKHPVQTSGNADAQMLKVPESDSEVVSQKASQAACATLLEVVKLEEQDVQSQLEIVLERIIKHLRDKVDSCLQAEVILVEKVNNLQIINDRLTEKEVMLEGKLKVMEEINVSRDLKEVSFKELIDGVEEANRLLQQQVKELKDSRNNLIQENQVIMQRILALESQTKFLVHEVSFRNITAVTTELPFEEESSSSHTEQAISPMENLNRTTEPLAKVTEDKMEGCGVDGTFRHSLSMNNNKAATPVRTRSAPDLLSENAERAYAQDKTSMSKRNLHDSSHGSEDIAVFNILNEQPLHHESRTGEETVQILLDDVPPQDADSQTMTNGTNGIPFSDAPLIGAPFRFASFIAKYLSGADLVA